MTNLLSARDLADDLELRDLTDPAAGTHAMQVLLADAVNALAHQWGCATETHRPRPLVAIEDNYDRLGYDPAAIARDSRYTRYSSETTMLRSHTSAGVPPALRSLARRTPRPSDVLLVLPGLTYRRDVIDRLHVGTPHQLDLWRIVSGAAITQADLTKMVSTLIGAMLPGASWRAEPARHPYTEHGLQVDVRTHDGDWVEVAECGLASPHVLGGAGLDPRIYSGLALGMGLDRALMLRKDIPDIRLLRATDPRIAEQMRDLAPWSPVSTMPPTRRDLSIVTDTDTSPELLGDQARSALGAAADVLESLAVQAITPHEQLPERARQRLGTMPGQANALLRVVLRPIDHTLTDQQANVLRDRIYAALHHGPYGEWATRPQHEHIRHSYDAGDEH